MHGTTVHPVAGEAVVDSGMDPPGCCVRFSRRQSGYPVGWQQGCGGLVLNLDQMPAPGHSGVAVLAQ
ncbi:hypothetical protein [Amycolatopsis sp. VC5-11]|uniref:hypothetical protein n=1 Tax=Amycolatopsis sp. VC5-11 TaxID=3120156 RepID=UPI003008BC91